MKRLIVAALVALGLTGCAYPVGTTWGNEDNYNQTISCRGDVYIGDYVLEDTYFKQLRVSWGNEYLIAGGGQILKGMVSKEKVFNLTCKDSYE